MYPYLEYFRVNFEAICLRFKVILFFNKSVQISIQIVWILYTRKDYHYEGVFISIIK